MHNFRQVRILQEVRAQKTIQEREVERKICRSHALGCF